MKDFFTRAATTALAGCVIFGFASAAFAHHYPQQRFVERESIALLNTARATGHTVLLDVGPCRKTKGLLGFATQQKQLVICTEAHGKNLNELADTIRHESFHLVQFCKARNGGATGALLFPELAEANLETAVNELHMPRGKYDERQHYMEAEARVAAQLLEEEQIAQAMIQECGK